MNVKITFSNKTEKTIPYTEWVSQKEYCKKHKIYENTITGIELLNYEPNNQNNHSQRKG